MDEARLRFDRPVTLLGAGPAPEADLALALAHAPELVAADGGAARAVELGLEPAMVIGDLDSIDPLTRARIGADRVLLIEEQDSTDFDKCLRTVEAPFALGVGFVGARIDHELAALNALVRRPEKRCVLVGPSDVIFAAPPEIVLDFDPGMRLSLFPLARISGRSEGLRWPIEGLVFEPDGRSGTSNRTTGPVRLSFDTPGMLVIAPRRALPIVLRSFAG